MLVLGPKYFTIKIIFLNFFIRKLFKRISFLKYIFFNQERNRLNKHLKHIN